MILATKTDDRGVVTLVLNRANKANSINGELLSGLFAVLQKAAKSKQTRLVVIRGSGRHFCAGADIEDLENHTLKPSIPELCEILDELPKPTIYVVQGACMGAGLALAACCDTVVASQNAYFCMPEVRLGVAPAPLIPLITRACSARFLRRYLLTGSRFDSHEARRAGLVHEICDPSSLEDTVASLIDDYLRSAPGAIKTVKALLAQISASSSSPSKIELQKVFNDLTISQEAKEGIVSFKERRPPNWDRS
jgi:methylglutaconyl-CoA hydratase